MTHRARIVIAPYSVEWPRRFIAESRRLRTALPAGFVVEHVGSTAVAGMSAKPIIDMMVGAPSMSTIESAIPLLVSLGYEYMPAHEAQMPDRRFLAFPAVRPRQFHLHGVVLSGEFWRDHLRFRDRLRTDPALAHQYIKLKQTLAQQYLDDRAAYTDAKTPFIRAVLSAEQEW